jgi:cysteine desulfurase/selenocysteine lyase
MRAELLERLEPSMIGGGAIDALGPDGFVVAQEPAWRRFEVGTPNIAGLIGLGAAAHYLNEQLPRHRDGLAQLTKQAHHGLAALPGVRLLSRPNRVGIVSFCLDAWSPHAAAMALDEDFGVMLRSGHHCALPLMRHLGEAKGCLRASFHVYSDEEDLDLLLAGVRALCEQQ